MMAIAFFGDGELTILASGPVESDGETPNFSFLGWSLWLVSLVGYVWGLVCVTRHYIGAPNLDILPKTFARGDAMIVGAAAAMLGVFIAWCLLFAGALTLVGFSPFTAIISSMMDSQSLPESGASTTGLAGATVLIFVVIGIYVYARLAITVPLAGVKGRISLAESWAATRPHYWRILLSWLTLLAILLILVFVIGYPLMGMIAALISTGDGITYWLGIASPALAAAFVGNDFTIGGALFLALGIIVHFCLGYLNLVWSVAYSGIVFKAISDFDDANALANDTDSETENSN